ncbi:MAG TPA: aquaporin [Candidatus Saccharimonadales bacterium]|nr:aquaporin [Candidatus Saccharimonadales bacterium]
MFSRQKVAALVGEFLGAGVLTLLILSVQRSTIGVPFFVAIAAGLAVATMSFAVGGISGGHFNPAITLGFWTARRVTTIRAILYIAVQLLGAWVAYLLYTYFVNNTLPNIGGHYSGRIMVAEMVGTGLFGFGFAATLYNGFNRVTTACLCGLALVVGIIAASSASLALLNPAVALGARAWVWGTYVLGPVVGGIVGINLYALLFTQDGVKELTAAVSTGAGSAASTKKSTGKKSKK